MSGYKYRFIHRRAAETDPVGDRERTVVLARPHCSGCNVGYTWRMKGRFGAYSRMDGHVTVHHKTRKEAFDAVVERTMSAIRHIAGEQP